MYLLSRAFITRGYTHAEPLVVSKSIERLKLQPHLGVEWEDVSAYGVDLWQTKHTSPSDTYYISEIEEVY